MLYINFHKLILFFFIIACHGAVVFECDFDAQDVCGMEQWDTDFFNWDVGQTTPSGNTGPSADHTTGSGKYNSNQIVEINPIV